MLTGTFPLFAQTIPEEWHQPANEQERQFANRIVAALKHAPDFPKVKAWRMPVGIRGPRQINAWESNGVITLPVEMFRFVEDDASALAFLLAHEAGHAKQEEIYGQSCYSAGKVKMSKFDWVRALADIAGGAATQGAGGAATALANVQKQACEDNADAWAVKFMRGAGLDPAGGIALFSKFMQLRGKPGWQHFAQQFTSDHSIDEVRIAHVTALILRKTGEEPSAAHAKVNSVPPSGSATSLNAQGTVPAGTEIIVTLNQSVSSRDAQTGQTIGGRVAEDVAGIIPRGSIAMLSVASVQSSGSLRGPPRLWLKIDSVEVNGKTYAVSSRWSGQTWLAGDIVFPPGTKLRFTLKSPLTIE